MLLVPCKGMGKMVLYNFVNSSENVYASFRAWF
jgi:hypothetical protein